MEPIHRYLRDQPEWLLAGIAILVVVALGLLDYATGPLYSFSIFYLIPVALAATYLRRSSAIAISLLATAVWVLADMESLAGRPPFAVDVWNALIRIGFLVVVSLALYSVRAAAERESATALAIQRGLFPEALPNVAGLTAVWSWRPARVVSGDYFDLFEIGDGSVSICIADVTGKGIPASLIMANVQAAVRLIGTLPLSPAAACDRIHRFLSAHVPPNRFVTLFLARLDPGTGILRYVNAGHAPPLLRRVDGTLERLCAGGPPVALFADPRFAEEEVRLRPGDRLVLYTDGLTEAASRDGKEFGESGITAVLLRPGTSTAQEIHDRILEGARRLRRGTFEDDLTLAVLAVEAVRAPVYSR